MADVILVRLDIPFAPHFYYDNLFFYFVHLLTYVNDNQYMNFIIAMKLTDYTNEENSGDWEYSNLDIRIKISPYIVHGL